jgi:hypothetical protein
MQRVLALVATNLHLTWGHFIFFRANALRIPHFLSKFSMALKVQPNVRYLHHHHLYICTENKQIITQYLLGSDI